MADICNSNNAQLLQLEAKRTTDSSWHPCHLSLRPTGGLAVNFEGQGLEDVIFTVEDALANLRVRSAPLQGDDCCHIEGKTVLAAYEKNSKKLFFDAVVKKVLRVRHSQRAFCRCNFMIKWLYHKGEDEILTIPSGSIMKLAAESIKSHPVVAAFLDSAESTSLFHTGLDETEHEININGLLGMQMKEMGTLVDVSKNGLVEDALLRGDHGVSFGGRDAQTKSPASEHACKLHAEVNCRHEELRSSTRKQEMKTKDENLMTNGPSCGQESREIRSRLNPLAARAALASLVSRTPPKIGFLLHEEEKHISVDLMNEMTMPPVHNSHHLHRIDDPEPANLVGNVKSLCKTEEKGQRADGSLLSAKNTRRELVLERDHRKNTFKDCRIQSPLSWSRDKESTRPVIAGRVTRSTIKQENRASNGEVKSSLLTEDVTSVRVTRSGAHKRNANMDDDVQEPLSGKPGSLSRRNSTAKVIESQMPKIEDNSETCSDKTNPTTLTRTTRVTRSAARKQTGTFDGLVKQSLHDRSDIESARSDYVQKYDCMSDFEASEKKRDSPSLDIKLKSTQRNKKQKASNDVERSQKTTVESLYTDAENQTPKRISSQDKLSQSSPQIICSLPANNHW